MWRLGILALALAAIFLAAGAGSKLGDKAAGPTVYSFTLPDGSRTCYVWSLPPAAKLLGCWTEPPYWERICADRLQDGHPEERGTEAE